CARYYSKGYYYAMDYW
nr:immunoglobulin heavy chain junction region [Mus musculus]